MKRTVWGPRKRRVLVHVTIFNKYLNEMPKSRKRQYIGARMRELKPAGGYFRYWEHRKRPYQTYDSESFYEDIPYFWKERYGE